MGEFDVELEFENFRPKEKVRKMFRWRKKYIYVLFDKVDKLEKEINKLKKHIKGIKMPNNYCAACGKEIIDKGWSSTGTCTRECHQSMIDEFTKEEVEDQMTKATKEFLENDREFKDD